MWSSTSGADTSTMLPELDHSVTPWTVRAVDELVDPGGVRRRWQDRWMLYEVTAADGFCFEAGYGHSLTWMIAHAWASWTEVEQARAGHVFDNVRAAMAAGAGAPKATWSGCWGVDETGPGMPLAEYYRGRRGLLGGLVGLLASGEWVLPRDAAWADLLAHRTERNALELTVASRRRGASVTSVGRRAAGTWFRYHDEP